MDGSHDDMHHLSSAPGTAQVLDQKRVNRLWEAVRLTSQEVIWELDPAGTMRFVSDAALDLLGSPPADLVGRSVFSVIHPDDTARARQIFADCLEHRTGWNQVRLRALRSDGGAPWVQTSGVAHFGPGNRLLGFTATTRRLDDDDVRREESAAARQRVEEVLAERSISTVWQPIYSLAHGGMIGLEALSRFRHPLQRTPDRWFAEAFAVGRGVELELLGIETALRGAACFPDQVYVSINLAPDTLAEAHVRSVLTSGLVPPERIVVELTEHTSIDNYELVSGGLGELRALGVRLAVDDAGAGFASFRHILRLSPDIIKLDRSITSGINGNPAQRALATAVVLFAMEVGSMSVTAEGVETAQDLETVSTLGLDAAQGYHIGRPVPAADLEWDRVIAGSWRIRRPRSVGG